MPARRLPRMAEAGWDLISGAARFKEALLIGFSDSTGTFLEL